MAREGRSLVLYVHPWGHLNDLVIPAGAIACMNAIPAPKRGRYAFEVTDDELREAAVVCIDVHWALALTGFERLVRHVRAVAADVPIVVGGIAAAHLAEELLEAYEIDYVFRGDAETSFAALIAALREGRAPGELPNVHAKGAPPPPRRRMTDAELDATDSVTIDWFPTLARVTDLDAVAFPPGRTVIVARGCPLRCPTCYGSHASTYGGGYLWRSPERTAALVHLAERAGSRNLRLIVGKPSPRRISEMIGAIAAAGPYRFGSAIGIYLCRAPSDDELDALERAFDSPVTISVVPPEEHVPALSPARLEEERAAWRRVAARVSQSRNLRLDVWATAGRDTAALREDLGSPGSERVSVSSGAVWSMTRPADGAATSLATVRAAVADVWTFYAARLLAPALAHLLAPFRFLDEVDDRLDDLPPPSAPALLPFHETIQRSWRAHRLPTLPGLSFDAVPVAFEGGRMRREGEGARFQGDLSIVEAARVVAAATPLEVCLDHRGVALEAWLAPLPTGTDAIAIVPRGAAPTSQAWVDAVGARGIVVLRPPATSERVRLRVDLRVQDARVFLIDENDEPRRRGVADLAYFRAAPAQAQAVPSRGDA
ncbi:MAG: cobalamin B12-binding domain-containing protein [Deltaproteobacteria bacterium]|nr:cobalamin B12-binding domain-containing protein [Deltaproteobacteria bacterium]